ncbi:GIY-YIG nuclease family protein [Nocardia sp. CA-107356]|uniref:GIY-YIG nuclease family protein n=1 Tax=Nocardia sp. CA-107356 TaxID=3239972 RepID=UPI003D9398A9
MQADYVYLIGGDECPRVKIGHSRSPEHRLAEFKTGFPFRMRVLWRHGGGAALERALHERFQRYRREGEWFEFGDIDAVTAISAATAELWESGAVDGRVRKRRFPTIINLNGLWIAYLAPGGVETKSFPGESDQNIPGLHAGFAACTAVNDAGNSRCPDTIGGYEYRPGQKYISPPEIEAIEFEGGWIISARLQLDALELDRWLRQRCRAHASPLHNMWCLPEWEPVDVAKHQPNIYTSKPDWPEESNNRWRVRLARMRALTDDRTSGVSAPSASTP